MSWDQPGGGRRGVRCTVLLVGALPGAEAAAPGTALCFLTPRAAAAPASAGSKESCMLLKENKGILNLSLLRLAAALRAPCAPADPHPWYSSANCSPGLGPAGLEHKAASYQRKHLSTATELRASLICCGFESISPLPQG